MAFRFWVIDDVAEPARERLMISRDKLVIRSLLLLARAPKKPTKAFH